jgi:hypothetical protein
VFGDEKDEKDLDTTSEEIEDLDAPAEEGDDVVGGKPPKIIVPTKTSGCISG